MEIIDRDAIDYSVEGHSLYEIVNHHEYAVLEAMRNHCRSNPGLCRCSLCVEDGFALLAMNSLPARYIQVTSLKTYTGSVHFIDEPNVREKVREAAEKVQADPKH